MSLRPTLCSFQYPGVSLTHLLFSHFSVACQASLSMGFPKQEYWSGLPFLPPGDLPDPGIEPASPALAVRFFTTEPPEKPILTLRRINRVHGDLWLLAQLTSLVGSVNILQYTC